MLGCARSTIAFHCKREGLNNPVRNNHPKGREAEARIKINRYCEYCDNEILGKRNTKYCSLTCSSLNNSKIRSELYIENWKKGLNSGGNKIHGKVSRIVRKYLFKKYDSKCSRCGWKEINPFTNTIPLEVEHIDGNPTNHKEENLVLLCPNCHSLSSGHSTAKGNGRRYYREKYHKEKSRDDNP